MKITIRRGAPAGRLARRVLRAGLAMLALAVAASWTGAQISPPQDTYPLTGRVVDVSDGDTLTLLVRGERERVRLASIDAPETAHGRKRPAQPYSQASRQALAGQVAGGTYTLLCYERDRYRRHICDVPLADGDTVSRRMVAMGMAWANMQGGGKYMRDPALPGLQDEARAARLGLWSQPGAVAPWEWRRRCWRALETGENTPIC